MLRRFWRWLRSGGRPRSEPWEQLPESLLAALDALPERFLRQGVEHALIGGVAMALHGFPRATKDVDFIVAEPAAEAAEEVMIDLGFDRVHRNKVFGNYVLGVLRVDLLFTQGEHSQRMLRQAVPIELRRVSTKLIRPEDLIALKLQALANNPGRAQDWADIHALLERYAHEPPQVMDMQQVRDYFIMFGREAQLDAALEAKSRRSPGDVGGRGRSGL